MARGNWNCEVIKATARCRLCRRAVKLADFVRLDGIYPAHRACADARKRAYTIGPEILPAAATHETQTMPKLINPRPVAATYTLRVYAPTVVDGLTVPFCLRTINANAAEFHGALIAIKAEAASIEGGSYHITTHAPTA